MLLWFFQSGVMCRTLDDEVDVNIIDTKLL